MLEDSPNTAGVSIAKRVVPIVAAVVIGGAGLGYAVHEHSNAQDLATQNQQVTSQLNATHSQLDALSAKVNDMVQANEAAKAAQAAQAAQAQLETAGGRRPAGHRVVVDSRYKKLQSQLDAQGKAIDAARADLANTQNDLVNTRTTLTGSIAHTHDELVVLEKKGERNYFEFDLTKSKDYKRLGPISISLRKANEKHQYADLQLMVDDRNLTQKHVNLYQPTMYYQPDSPQPIEIVINEVSKNHIHGYISAPKYRQSELTAMSNANANPAQGQDQVQGQAQGQGQPQNPDSQPVGRQTLPKPSPDSNQQ